MCFKVRKQIRRSRSGLHKKCLADFGVCVSCSINKCRISRADIEALVPCKLLNSGTATAEKNVYAGPTMGVQRERCWSVECRTKFSFGQHSLMLCLGCSYINFASNSPPTSFHRVGPISFFVTILLDVLLGANATGVTTLRKTSCGRKRSHCAVFRNIHAVCSHMKSSPLQHFRIRVLHLYLFFSDPKQRFFPGCRDGHR